jgi:hypothetical protein
MAALRAAQVTTKARPSRDEELRSAHRRAFTKISEAGAAADRGRAISLAVEELIDACEAYTQAR